MEVDQEVALVGDGTDQGVLHAACAQFAARLLQHGVGLRDAGVADHRRAPQAEVERYVERRHVRQAAEREQRVDLLDALAGEAPHVERAVGVDLK